MTFPLSIYSLDRTIFDSKALALSVPGVAGQLQILADHTPLISLLKEGNIIIEKEGAPEQTLPILGGVIEVKPKEVVVLVNF